MATALIEFVVGPIMVSLCGYMTFLMRENRKTSKANAKGTMLLLRKQIIAAHKQFCDKGDEMTIFDYEDLQEIHETYKDLGGNGLTDKMWQEIQAVKVANPD